jgi:hypothetical protein
MFTYYAQKPEYAARFAKAMAGATKGMLAFPMLDVSGCFWKERMAG